MGTKSKVSLTIILAAVLILGLWHLTSPQILPPVEAKYLAGTAFFEIGKLDGPRNSVSGSAGPGLLHHKPDLSQNLALHDLLGVVSKVNETVTESWVRSFSLRVTALQLQDNYDDSTGSWGKDQYSS